MVNSISASDAQQPGSVAQPVTIPASAPASTAGSAPAPQQDQVTLSLSAQVLALYQQDMSVNQIASNLGMTAQEVSNYLPGITTTTASLGGSSVSSGSGSTSTAPAAATGSSSAPAAAPAAAQGSSAAPTAAKG